MSQILHGILEPKILAALRKFGSAEYTGPDDAAKAQDMFAKELSLAISAAMQQYITAYVLTNPGQAVTTVGGPTNQAGATISPGTVTAQ